MATITGTVNEINIMSDRAKPDNFKPEVMSCMASIVVDGVRYSTFLRADKFNKFEMKCGKDGNWALVEVGDMIVMDFTENGQYKNFKQASLRITQKGAGTPVATPQPTAAVPFPTPAAPTGNEVVKMTAADRAIADIRRQLRIELQSARRDAVELFCTLTNIDGAIPKASLKKPEIIMGMIEQYTRDMFKQINTLELDPTGESLFDEDLKADEEAK